MRKSLMILSAVAALIAASPVVAGPAAGTLPEYFNDEARQVEAFPYGFNEHRH